MLRGPAEQWHGERTVNEGGRQAPNYDRWTAAESSSATDLDYYDIKYEDLDRERR